MYWVKRPWRQSFDFSGRATRREYWLFVLQLWLGLIVVAFVMGLFTALLAGPDSATVQAVPLVMLALILFSLLPFLSATIRRLHDHDKTGWMLLLWFIPAVGWIFFLIMMLTPGTEGENDFGPDPRERGFSAEDAYAVFS